MTNSPLLQHLKAIRILRDLDQETIKSICHLFETKTYLAGERIISENDVSNHVLAMCSGVARVSRTGPNGRQIMIRDVCQSELFGDWAAIDNLPRSANVRALTDSVVAFISQKNFMQLMSKNPQIAIRQMQQLTGYLRDMNIKISELLTLKANQRIQKVLLDIATSKEEGLVVTELPTHQEIALRANTQREVVARELSKLQSDGLMEKVRNGYLLPHPNKLDYFNAKPVLNFISPH